MRVNSIQLHPLYAVTGIAAIVVGGLIAATFAKMPSTLAMWSSAYLVLVVGVAQLVLAAVVARFVSPWYSNRALWIFGLFNDGNWIVILGTVLKYNGSDLHIAVTTFGAALIIGAMAALGWQLRGAKRSLLKTAACVTVAGLALSALVGVGLATLR